MKYCCVSTRFVLVPTPDQTGDRLDRLAGTPLPSCLRALWPSYPVLERGESRQATPKCTVLHPFASDSVCQPVISRLTDIEDARMGSRKHRRRILDRVRREQCVRPARSPVYNDAHYDSLMGIAAAKAWRVRPMCRCCVVTVMSGPLETHARSPLETITSTWRTTPGLSGSALAEKTGACA